MHLALSPQPATLRSGARGCCTVEDANDARRAADVLGIPFYVWDLAERFRDDVIDDFVAEYAAGRTPNPCLRCNEKIKFAAVLDRALALGFDAVVTGHHARLADGELRRSVDAAKDQSYVLGRAHAGRSSRTRCSRSATRPRSRCGRAPPSAASRSPTSPTRTTSASSPTATPAASWPAGSARGPGRSSTPRRVRPWASTTARSASPSASARASASPSATSAPRYVLGIEPVSRTVTVGTADLAAIDEVVTGPPDVDRSGAGAAARGPGPAAGARRTRAAARSRAAPDGGLRIALAGGAARRGARAVGRALRAGRRPRRPRARPGADLPGRGPHRVSGPWGPATGIGSLPGTEPVEALRLVLGELPDLAHLPELPARGPGADLIGRTAALLVDLAVDLTPAGWRLVPRSGIDQRRARRVPRARPRRADRRRRRFHRVRSRCRPPAPGPWPPDWSAPAVTAPSSTPGRVATSRSR